MRDIAAVGFDVDGTLYPEWRLYLRTWQGALSSPRLFAAFARTRQRLRRTAAVAKETSFYDLQALTCAKELGAGDDAVETVKAAIARQVYGTVERYFDGIRPYPYVRETLCAMKESGLKLAILSDFPLARKLESLRLSGMWDAELCSEEIGALKPHPLSFLRLAEQLDLPPERILYVGNNPRYDIAGAKNAGMKAALRCSFPRFPLRHGQIVGSTQKFAFNDYRQLKDYVLR
ncbi:MAG: HAD family hydrolase [Spirochaetaceae bacterium]|jgi:putative hydrolase of the HAD superfamily|nr:HAD family hydrolase [Spirochaetaceae bacterium]